MNEDKNAAEIAATAAAKEAEDAAAKAEADKAASQDPLKKELDKVANKSPRTEAEKLIHTANGIVKRAKEIGVDLKSVLGEEPALDDDKPLTRGDLNKIQREQAQQTALSLADDIDNEHERDLVKFHLENTIKSSGNASEDFKNARAIVNSVKSQQVAEEVGRKSKPRANSSAAGAASKAEDEIFEPTAQEAIYMRSPFNLTEKQIKDARKQAAEAK